MHESLKNYGKNTIKYYSHWRVIKELYTVIQSDVCVCKTFKVVSGCAKYFCWCGNIWLNVCVKLFYTDNAYKLDPFSIITLILYIKILYWNELYKIQAFFLWVFFFWGGGVVGRRRKGSFNLYYTDFYDSLSLVD